MVMRNKNGRNAARGFSITEVIVVVTIVLVVASFAIPNVATAVASVRLRGSASDLSGLLQRARLASVQNNATYTVRFTTGSVLGAYVDLNNNSQWDSNEPMIQFGSGVQQVATPNGSGGAPTALDGAGGPLGWTATSGNISFNARGLPCDVTKTPCGTNVGYVFYLSNKSFGGPGWAAVSMTAAGRVKVCMWGGTGWSD
jgi:prepilin-type N-terminal cleavage/methylation domain-containing protein